MFHIIGYCTAGNLDGANFCINGRKAFKIFFVLLFSYVRMRNDTPPSLASTHARINNVIIFDRVNGEGVPRLQGRLGCCWRGISMQTRGWEQGRFFRCGCSKI